MPNKVPNNWAEEGTSSGFIQARLQKQHGAVHGALITAVLFTIQHVALVIGSPLGPALLLMGFLLITSISSEAPG